MTTQTKDKPILFSGEMVCAILEGRKTQTRRVFKLLPDARYPNGYDISKITQIVPPCPAGSPEAQVGWTPIIPAGPWPTPRRCPYGQPGDRLWVRETWQGQNGQGKWWHEWPADDRACENWAWTNPVVPAYPDTPPRWLPSIHMPRMACRLVLEIVNLRVERVQSINERDAIAEGIDEWEEMFRCGPDGDPCWTRDACRAYAWLWNSINEKRGFNWDANPWVWVVEFKLAKP